MVSAIARIYPYFYCFVSFAALFCYYCIYNINLFVYQTRQSGVRVLLTTGKEQLHWLTIFLPTMRF
jgi:hypothetical protein